LIALGAYLALGVPVACGSRTPLFFEPPDASSSGGFAGTQGFAGFGGSGGTEGEGLDCGPPLEGGEDVFGDRVNPFEDGPEGSTMCEPGSLTGFTPALNPSAITAGMCTAKQIVDIVNVCFSAKADAGSACESLLADSATKQCFTGCVSTEWTAAASGTTYTPSPWGGLLYTLNPGQTTYIDLGACIVQAAPAEKSAQTCGKDYEELVECALSACAANCSVPLTTGDCSTDPACEAAETALYSCMEATMSSGCKKYNDAVTADCAPLMDAGSGLVSDCVRDVGIIESVSADAGVESAALIQYLDIICLGGLPDGG
jgi:hypothetical protein